MVNEQNYTKKQMVEEIVKLVKMREKDESFIRMLNEQYIKTLGKIEKMKCCGNCQTVRDAEGNCYLEKDGKCKDKDKWELRR